MAKIDIRKGPFEPTFESLRQFQCPDWFKDAKLGFWSHWGAQSLPMQGDWYAQKMYYEGSDCYRYHIRNYGHPSKFGYKDLVQLWKAEKFDPEGLMDLFVEAGAKYFVAQAMHHDHFFNYNSKIHKWNSVNMGPHKDIVGLWKAASQKRGLPFGITEHMGATFSWWNLNKGCDLEGPYAGVPYDGSDPAYEDFYLPNQEHFSQDKPAWKPNSWYSSKIWYTPNKWWHQRWLDVMKEVIDLYQPDMLYSDGKLPFGLGPELGPNYNDSNLPFVEETFEAGLHAIAHLYNTSAANHGGINQAIYNQKDKRKEVYSIGILDIECSQEPNIKAEPWQSDTGLGHWFYDVHAVYKKPGHVIEMLIDIISKNGNLLLNIPQKADGTVDDECLFILKELAGWNKVCVEGVYGTRPFRVSGEGTSKVLIEGFKEEPIDWTSSDYRFTTKGSTLYAFQMRWPENDRAVIKSLTPEDRVKSVRLLGAGKLPFEQAFGTLVVNLPDTKPTKYVNCLAIELG